MTPQEKLKEIKLQVESEHRESDIVIQPERSWLRTIEEREWLIARVEQLEHALTFYGSHWGINRSKQVHSK